MSTTAAPSYITPPEFAEMLGVDVKKIHEFIRSGELKAINLAESADGKRPRWRLCMVEVNRFLESRSTAPPDKPAPRRRRRQATSGREWF